MTLDNQYSILGSEPVGEYISGLALKHPGYDPHNPYNKDLYVGITYNEESDQYAVEARISVPSINDPETNCDIPLGKTPYMPLARNILSREVRALVNNMLNEVYETLDIILSGYQQKQFWERLNN